MTLVDPRINLPSSCCASCLCCLPSSVQAHAKHWKGGKRRPWPAQQLVFSNVRAIKAKQYRSRRRSGGELI
eukprot:34310-Eustigmatos_ZCMA.PRE.1